MKSAIDMMPRNLPNGEYSHTGAWAFLRANQLKHVGIDAHILGYKNCPKWSEFDRIYLYHTMDFDQEHKYAINIFDGPQEHTAKYFERLIWPENDHCHYVSLDYPMPDYGYRCKRKRDRADETSKMSEYWKNVDWDKVQERCEGATDWILDPGVQFTLPYAGRTKAEWVNQVVNIHHVHRRLVMGDSHTPSAYVPKSIVLRKDGRTLRGILKKSIKKEAIDFGYDWDQIDEVSCYYGNIDIRHHLCREEDPIQAAKDMIRDYEAELRKYPNKMFEVVTPLPIEDESRKLPSTGYYLKTPFFGSRKQRQEVVDVFRTELHEMTQRNGWKLFSWPEHWYKMDGVEFMSTVMERPRSVHLARKYYRWNLVEDRLNDLLLSTKKVNLLQY
jgi:hypothetical protein